MTIKHTFKENVLRVVAVIGLIAVLLLGAWGIIQLAFVLPGFFSGSNSGNTASAKETLVVSLPSAVTSEQAFPISWNHRGQSGTYSYAISYSCTDGVSMKTLVPTGAWQTVACNTPFNYTNASTTTGLVPILTGTKNVPVTITVAATKLATGAVTATGSGTTMVGGAQKVTAQKTVTAKTSSSSTKYVPAARTTNLYGYADLAVSVVSAPSAVPAGSRTSIQFVVQNIGTNVAPAGWTLNTTLPYTPVYTYDAGPQRALYPGDKVVYTLTFDAPYNYNNNYNPCTGWSFPCTQPTPVNGGPGTCNQYGPCNVPGYPANNYAYTYPTPNYGGTSVITIQVDPYNALWEMSEVNNTATIPLQVY